MSKPLAIDLYCGLGGWTEGLLSEGWDVVGFDIEAHQYGEHRYPADLVLQDVRTIHGSQFKDASLIVASSPCQKYSYMAMPWTRAKALIQWYRDPTYPERLAELNELFEQPARIQREACEAAGRYIPMVQENVCGAQRWVGRARWHHGSYYLWGDVPALMPATLPQAKAPGQDWNRFRETGEVSQFNYATERATKLASRSSNQRGGWFHDNQELRRGRNTMSSARKAASARIAKIPFALASHIAHVYYPRAEGA